MPNILPMMMSAAGAAGGAANEPGTLWCWGSNNKGILGQGKTTHQSSAVQVGALTDWLARDASERRKIKISVGTWVSCIKSDGTLWSMGQSESGTIGNGANIDVCSPVQCGSLTDWDNVGCGTYSVMAVKTDGTLWGWGANDYGALGLGNTTSYSSPVQCGSLTDWSIIHNGGNNFYGIKTDGTLWAWGQGGGGALGNGVNTDNFSSPVQVGSLTDWAQVCGGADYTAAVKTDGTLWAWGTNTDGELGLGNTTSNCSPTQVGSLTDWYEVSMNTGSAPGPWMCATKTDGTLWAWGTNTDGQLGVGNTTTYSSPVQVGGLTTWRNASAVHKSTLADTTAGTLFAWGDGANGLGNGATADISSPVQVGSNTDISGINSGINTDYAWFFVRAV